MQCLLTARDPCNSGTNDTSCSCTSYKCYLMESAAWIYVAESKSHRDCCLYRSSSAVSVFTTEFLQCNAIVKQCVTVTVVECKMNIRSLLILSEPQMWPTSLDVNILYVANDFILLLSVTSFICYICKGTVLLFRPFLRVP